MKSGRYEYKPRVVEAIRILRTNQEEVRALVEKASPNDAVVRYGFNSFVIYSYQGRLDGELGYWLWINPEGKLQVATELKFREIFQPEGLEKETILDGFDLELNEARTKGEPFGGWPAYDH